MRFTCSGVRGDLGKTPGFKEPTWGGGVEGRFVAMSDDVSWLFLKGYAAARRKEQELARRMKDVRVCLTKRGGEMRPSSATITTAEHHTGSNNCVISRKTTILRDLR